MAGSNWPPDQVTLAKRIERWNQRLQKLMDAQEFWRRREIERIGWSPTAEFITFEELSVESVMGAGSPG